MAALGMERCSSGPKVHVRMPCCGLGRLKQCRCTWTHATLSGLRQAWASCKSVQPPLPTRLPGPMSVCSGTVRRSTSLSLGAAAVREAGGPAALPEPLCKFPSGHQFRCRCHRMMDAYAVAIV